MNTDAPLPAFPADEPQVARVIYASQALVQISVYSEMERIRTSAVAHNMPERVFTALLYRSGWFLHWKEGPGAALPRIMEHVAKDPRHHSSQIVHSSWGPRLLAGVWSMAILQSDEQASEMSTRVAEVRRELSAGRQHSAVAVWQRLSMPVAGGSLGITPPLQSILVVSASGPQPFELVQWLKEKSGGESVAGRLAGLDVEVGMAYVDCEQPDQVLRVVALARNGLGVPLIRAMLHDYSHVVMLLGTAEDDNQRLIALVEAACSCLTSPPALVAVGGTAQSHSDLRALAHRRGMTCLQPPPASGTKSADCWHVIEPQLAIWHRPAGAPPSYRPEDLLDGPLRAFASRLK